MSYKRKQDEKLRFKRLLREACYGYPWALNEKQSRNSLHYVRLYKSSGKHSSWAINKKRYNRNLGDKTNYHKIYPLWWKVW